MNPIYTPAYIQEPADVLANLLNLEWLSLTEARSEYFMSTRPRSYTYGKGDHARTYDAKPFESDVMDIRLRLNQEFGTRYNVCFLNRYDNQKQQLGWHADDSPTMDREHPIAVISFGAEREIWWKPQGEEGIVPADQRQRLGSGSLFVMPAGFQDTHFHRIPKADREVGVRISLTFRRYNA